MEDTLLLNIVNGSTMLRHRVSRLTGGLLSVVRKIEMIGGASHEPIFTYAFKEPAGPEAFRPASLNEMQFYASTLDTRLPHVPKCYAAHQLASGAPCIAIEYISGAEDIRQIFGCDRTLSLSVLKALFELSKCYGQRERLAWMTTGYLNLGITISMLDIIEIGHRDIPSNAELHKFIAIVRRALPLVSEILAAVRPSELTFCHGDFHIQNVIATESQRRITLIDFQFCHLGHPLFDLARFCATSLLPENRREYEPEFFSILESCNNFRDCNPFKSTRGAKIYWASLVASLIPPVAIHIYSSLFEGEEIKDDYPMLRRVCQAIQDWEVE